MRPVLCQLGCWVTREGADNATVIVRPKAAKSKDVPLCLSDPPSAPLPHFHEETSALIRGDFWVIYKLPRVKAKALKRARRSASRAVHLEQKDTSSPKSGGRRAAATVVDHRSRPIPIPIRTSSRNQHSKPLQIQSPRVSTVPISPFPPLSPLPSPISTPTQSPPQTPINPNSNNPDNNSPSPNPDPIYSLAHLAGGRYHYTSPEAQTIFAAVVEHYNSADRARAQLAATPSLTPTGGSLLAFFLLGSGGLHDPLSRGEARRVFRASAPALADLVDEVVDWTGVEEEEDEA
ncbi:predicted protein [Chaetomium globosum CBS 148.51]|uniref:Uncharacterized protein n=1 Tax=Chaetomium globosum (strain ATCC 6205 / CBS 148.51 / DSM 1962 / NBRC 6347 / NRRL 1970) TaxID=306901 RepID=Q2HG77_CHAGB|nr:uncharacterized protein CHGG_00777 [Chaetomium globosum CBS 148.51]EAQ92542.1 predicted protein [Chaetomium globosum CBS 148.51]